MKPHLWQGTWISDKELEEKLLSLADWPNWNAGVLDISILLEASEKYSQALKNKKGNYTELLKELEEDGPLVLQEMANFLERDHLEEKLRRELGSTQPFLPTRTQYKDSIFESWAPLGLLVHIAPSNSPTVAPLALIEGLLSGNMNFLKTSGSESLFPQLFLKGLLDCDPSQTLQKYVISARISSKKTDWLKAIFSVADGVSVWGGEESVQAVKEQVPSSARVIEWGHKISFIYVSRSGLADPKLFEKVAQECCTFEQQACSSPQCIYLETQDSHELFAWGERFAETFARVSLTTPRIEPSPAERGEITLVTELARQESVYGNGKVIESPSKEWRVLIDSRPTLTASPLYRSVWLKPLPRKQILTILRPMRSYLQTVGLSANLADIQEISDLLLRSGVLRIRQIGEMSGSYNGEPHDGVYALARFCRRISIQLGPESQGISSFSDLRENLPPHWDKKPPVLTKEGFQETSVDPQHAHLFFKSGGSSGEPKLSLFTYQDYADQMKIGAEGLYAAGLNPLRDRSMNLFFSGAMYGGFISIFSVLEILQAPQLPMAAQTDFEMVADAIIKNKINVLLGMPSYLMQLFERSEKKLKSYGEIRKIFYGGEHFNDAQRRLLTEEFGILLIRSVGYGSVDTGPLAYQCKFSEGGVHHLHQRLQYLEILDLEKDQPAPPGAVGRLIFTSKMRKGQKLDRYELGDVGQWVGGPCPCGRVAPRFKLLGRSGDIFRIGSVFLNYQKFSLVLSETLHYAGALQIELLDGKSKEKLVLRISQESTPNSENVHKTLLENYDDLCEIVSKESLLDLEIKVIPSASFEHTPGSGKLIRILDRRTRS